MKNVYAVIATTVLVLAVFGGVATAQELVANGGFEAGISSWTRRADGAHAWSWLASEVNGFHFGINATVHSGNNALTLESTDGGAPAWSQIIQSIAVTANTDYFFSGWMNVVGSAWNGTGDQYASMSWSDNGTTWHNIANTKLPTYGWRQYSATVTPTTTQLFVLCYARFNQGTNIFAGDHPRVEIDDVSVVSVAPATVPEPSSILFLAALLAGCGGQVLRRRAQR